MPTLSRELRKSLEHTIVEAREVAEEAAEKALETLAVGEAESHRTLTPEQKALRSRLRAHGKQSGDRRNESKGTQDIDHLISECAYEQWHRMLFARFLAENQLLLEPDSGVAVTIDEVKELAQERGRDWVDLSGEFAVRMLPHVFRQGDPVLEVQLAPEDRRDLDELLASLSAEVFTASDSLGWTYQFWQTERKNEVNAAGDKIGADELPAVTQLFTEDYMVDFLLDNTLGAWHAGKLLAANPKLAADAQSEHELRRAVALPGCPWQYLRFIKGEDGQWKPAAGAFDGWPKGARELKCLDPCMGSGHFVVAMFERLVAVRMAEEPLDEAAALAAVIRENLFGLEIDPRCTQIGAFNLALAAWRRVGHCALPAMNLACSGLAPNTREVDWLAIAGNNEKLKNGMARLYRLFNNAPVLGSLINPSGGEGDLLEATFHELQPLLEKALAQEAKDDADHEMAVTAQGLAKAAEILARRFTLIATNVPYLARGKQDEVLMEFCERVFPTAKAELATCFVERCLEFCAVRGTAALVTPQNWLFLTSYAKLRESLLEDQTWNIVARLGTNAFQDMNWWAATTSLVCLTSSAPDSAHLMTGMDVSSDKDQRVKASMLSGALANTLFAKRQSELRNSPDARITLEEEGTSLRLGNYAASLQGIATADFSKYGRMFWEFGRVNSKWSFQQGTVVETCLFGGREGVVMWEGGKGELSKNRQARIQGLEALGKHGVVISQMRLLPATLFDGDLFDNNVAAIIPKKHELLPALWAFCSSLEFTISVRAIDQKSSVTNATFAKVPFDLVHWQKVASETYPDGLPRPFSSDPTQWLFNGHPAGADQPLHVAVARVLGFRWPRQTGSSFPDCPALGPDGLENLADTDGIVCLSAIKGERPAAEQLRELLARAYGDDWNATHQEALLAQVEYGGASLEDWLRSGFFGQHCAIFHQRPFIWHICDGLEDGFHALVNYHQLAAPNGEGHRTLEKLTFSYLGDWITRQKAEQKSGREGADDKLAAAIHLQNELRNILTGEPPYDLFVRWRPLYEQAIGWQPDINDGVRMNARPFMVARTLKGKSIFRKAPRIKWEKDRGKEAERPKRDFPWYWNWAEGTEDFQGGRDFDGNRWNDVHYSSAAKREARDRHKEKGR